MKINGDYVLNGPKSIVWNMLMDPEILEKTTPGIETLTKKGEDSYDAVSMVRVGPVKGEFKGTLSIEDKIQEESCKLVVNQNSKMGNVVATIDMKLNEKDDKTEISYTGEAKLSGTLASMGQRIMGGVVGSLSEQFFKSMEEELQSKRSTSAAVTEVASVSTTETASAAATSSNTDTESKMDTKTATTIGSESNNFFIKIRNKIKLIFKKLLWRFQ